jgi:glycosyltransferase involved in cell wall biosynthesis
MRILVVSLLYPLPGNAARGTFVADHVQALRKDGHEVRVVNPLPRMMRYQEARRSTLTGAARAPREFEHGGVEVFAPRYTALPEHPWPNFTARSIRKQAKKVEKWLGEWKPEVIVCHTLWPVAVLAKTLALRLGIPWVGVVHGYDFDVGLNHSTLSKITKQLACQPQRLVVVSQRLVDVAKSANIPDENIRMIPCHCAVEDEWLKPLKPWKGRWRKDRIDVLFPSDPRRPEKNHLLALQTGEILERRGWIVGMTTLKIQPRSIVWDRMLVADLTLITSKRESGPLVARESIACGTPVVSVDVGDVATYLPQSCIADAYDATLLADACENALQHRWDENFTLPLNFSHAHFLHQWNQLLEELVA